MKLAYLAHPLSPQGNETIDSNLAAAKAIYRRLSDEYPTHVFLAPWILNCEVYDDKNPEHRRKGFERNIRVIEACSEFWLTGPRISNGMHEEMIYAQMVAQCEIINRTPEALILDDCETHVIRAGGRICEVCGWRA